MLLKSCTNALDALLSIPDNLSLDTKVIQHVFHPPKFKRKHQKTPKKHQIMQDLTRTCETCTKPVPVVTGMGQTRAWVRV
jgi:hypothetical protein